MAGGSLKPEALALIDAYKVLNNSIYMTGVSTWRDVLSKRIDLHLYPIGSGVLTTKIIFADAQYTPSPLCFFTPIRRANKVTFIDSWTSLLWLTIALVSAGGALALYIQIRCRFVSDRQQRYHAANYFLFFVATFLGKSPPSSRANALAFRGLATGVWMVGMMVLANYVQSSITAIRTVPTTQRNISSFTELFRSIDSRDICPCLNTDWQRFLTISFGALHILRISLLRQIAIYCDRTTTFEHDVSRCYHRAQLGTNVALSVCTSEEVQVASHWNLLPGDLYQTMVQAPVIHAFNPLR
ncbi:hypothetical protein HPB49_010069 [Dermacentor silvarum]|uniref:Uncharacterized protein n=1 Tax=Dermacentor silvarum TaxID=543639 RepID=A0ACB8CWN9_DERSI|nr:hypothetical protein HPB49_010069 [Dermacentor silvarum]